MTNTSKHGEENEVEALIRAIHLRFPVTPAPDIVVQVLDLDAQNLLDTMQGRPWTEVDFAVAVRNTGWFYVMSDDVLAYYLPSYLVGYLSSWPQTLNSSRPKPGGATLVDSFDEFVFMLDIPGGSSVDTSRMDAGMKACVGEFLRFFAVKHRSATAIPDFSGYLETLRLIWLEWS